MTPKQLTDSNLPLDRVYWVEPRRVLAGSYAGNPDLDKARARLKGLFDMGIRTIINLMEVDEQNRDGEPFVPYEPLFRKIARAAGQEVEVLRFPIKDNNIPSTILMKSILAAIEASLEEDRPVYIHCMGGIGRTGTVVSCWLLQRGLATKANVFDVLAKLRVADKVRGIYDSPEPGMQRNFVQAWSIQSQSTQSQSTQSQSVKSQSVESRFIESANSQIAKSKVPPLKSGRDWFTRLMGFTERDSNEVREWITVDGETLTSKVNGVSYQAGRLEIASLRDFRTRLAGQQTPIGNFGVGKSKDRESGAGGNVELEVGEWVGDVTELHRDPANANAMFQVASQFNLLEMVGPEVTPERGVGRYENDRTQGPACAIACGAGTIYRNYFVPVGGQIGQSAKYQVDCLADLGEALGNEDGKLWKMSNGYALPSARGLDAVVKTLGGLSESELDLMREKLRIGVHWDTQVTLADTKHCVNQVYGSALPIGYSSLSPSKWEIFARLVLDASYEATFAAAALNLARGGNPNLYLTTIGGGVFGNPHEWIFGAITRACKLFRKVPLKVTIVSYGHSSLHAQQLIRSWRS